MSKAIDLITVAGTCLVLSGLYLWRPCFALVFLGAMLLWVARHLALMEKSREADERER